MARKSLRKRFVRKKRHRVGVPTFEGKSANRTDTGALTPEKADNPGTSGCESSRSRGGDFLTVGEQGYGDEPMSDNASDTAETLATLPASEIQTSSVQSHDDERSKASSVPVDENPKTLSGLSSCKSPSNSTTLRDHDYISCRVTDDMSENNYEAAKTQTEDNVAPTPCLTEVPYQLLLQVKGKIESFLPKLLVAIIHQKALHVLQLSPFTNLSIQRTIVFFPNGGVELFVHRQKISVHPYLSGVSPPLPFDENTVNYFVDRSVCVVNKVREMETCSGYDDEKFKSVWSSCLLGKVDDNPYGECRYDQTFRSLSCLRLVNHCKWRCTECAKLYYPLRRRLLSSSVSEPHAFTNNEKLSELQKLKKLQNQQRRIIHTDKKVTRLRAKMQELITKEGIEIEENMSDDLTNILRNADLNPAQSIFLQQQVKASQQKNRCGMRWHPVMIRLALAVHLTSPAAFELLRDTGMLKLPSSRTLFDYSHARPTEDSIDRQVLDSLSERVDKLDTHRKYHVLMCDEMHISQNLLFQKSTGKLIGYTKLDNIDREVQLFNQYLDNPEKEVEETMASKVLVYMVKGVAVGIKEVIATYPVSNPSSFQLYKWTWQVVGALERSGVPIVAIICDGFSTNRKFIRMHKPATSHPDGIVYDTLNKAAPHRNLYFVSDVPHLLKTIRNCFMNSRWDQKRSRRRMMYRGRRISWDFIIKLYESQKGKSLRKSFKLNAMNVYPDSYARMKVKYAAEVISRTVAQDLCDREWEEASETVAFIRLFNDWFDCLNGAHSFIGKKKRNTNLNPYTKDVLGENPSDTRFQFLDSVLDFLKDWKDEAGSGKVNVSVADSTRNLGGQNDDSEIFEGEADAEDDTPGRKRILSRETLEGIQMSTLAIKALITFLLQEGIEYINPRVFTQDPLEQHFGKVRAGQGGSNNPNYAQVLNRNRAIHTVGQLGMKRRKGNSDECFISVEVGSEHLAKRKSARVPKFNL